MWCPGFVSRPGLAAWTQCWRIVFKRELACAFCHKRMSETQPLRSREQRIKRRTRCKHPVLKGAYGIHNALRVVDLLRVLQHLRRSSLKRCWLAQAALPSTPKKGFALFQQSLLYMPWERLRLHGGPDTQADLIVAKSCLNECAAPLCLSVRKKTFSFSHFWPSGTARHFHSLVCGVAR